ncbi:GlgB N-terminal domain-containing protein [uncultured Anaerococcus sp.]|uniref:GlgB N-terminal domain-containing protein n=1 Tax=uncultured Anaerococcus sp. TaxID=293428 RepID=UPI0026334AAF|nr:glycogen-branching protein [uncultured Anaerococcus sp.]
MNTKEYLSGKSKDGYKFFGSHKKENGYIFRTLAPNAEKVEIIGDFNDWQAQSLRKYTTGVFSITCKNAKANDRYQYIIHDKDGNTNKKLDPFSRSILIDENCTLISKSDYDYQNERIKQGTPNIYQVHLASFLKDKDKSLEDSYEYLIKHAKDNNFTHISLMPVNEYKNYKSMGYASIGLFALSSRYGSIDDFKLFIDKCHEENMGIILELDLGEFDPDPYYLANFDSTRLFDYDYDDIRYNYYGSMNFDPSKNNSKSYLLSVVNYWINEFNIDGVSIANAENIIYWQGDKNRGVNQDGKSLLDELIKLIRNNNCLALANFNGIYDLNLDFDYVFDNSMRSILRIFQRPAIKRDAYKGEVYKLINSNNCHKVLGFSYVDSYLDEASLSMKMYGDINKFDQLKSLLTLTYSLNSAKMIFMGNEVADLQTFSIYNNVELDNIDLDQENFNKFYCDLSKLYNKTLALSDKNSSTQILDIGGYSIYAYIREYKNEKLLVIINLTDIEYSVISPYRLEELLNTNDLSYGASGNINGNIMKNEKIRIAAYGSAIFKIK